MTQKLLLDAHFPISREKKKSWKTNVVAAEYSFSFLHLLEFPTIVFLFFFPSFFNYFSSCVHSNVFQSFVFLFMQLHRWQLHLFHNWPLDGSERTIFFRQDARAGGKLVCLGFSRGRQRLVESASDGSECGEGITSGMRVCEFPLLTHTQTEVSHFPVHTRTASSLFFWTTQSSRSVGVEWQHLWQSNYSWKINWSSQIRVCYLKCPTVFGVFHFFHFETQQTAPARPLFFSAPHKFFS